jgi:ribonuclease G
LGLVEMTRKRVRESLISSVSETCFYCGGIGLLKSRTTIAHEIYRSLVRETDQIPADVVHIAVHPRIAEALLENEQAMMEELSLRSGKRLSIEIRPDFHMEHFEFSGVDQQGRLMGRKFTAHDGLHDPSGAR